MQSLTENNEEVAANDPDIVEWEVIFEEKVDGMTKYEVINTHLCTEEDFSQFHSMHRSENATFHA